MSLEKIIAISGKPGLYELLSQTRGGFVVRSLADDKKMSISMRNNVSVLNEISIYTYEEEVPLQDVFLSIAEKYNKEQIISHKSSKNELEALLKEVLPNFDEDRVYTSDIKKIVQWYNILQKSGIIENLESADDAEEKVVAEVNVDEEE